MTGRLSLTLAVGAVVLFGVAVWIARGGPAGSGGLGPADGHGLPPTALDRVGAGGLAPDFSLRALSGNVVTLSDFRGGHNVVLVFYRGHW